MRMRQSLVCLAVTSFLATGPQAVAQQDNAASESPKLDDSIVIEEVFVTGSLLPKGDFVSKAPIATISSTQFEMSNTTNVEALINSMPQVVGGADRSSTFGQGIATANLRGLGENRTLVLINSRRFVPTFPDGATVDLNFIPVGLIDRVEVLTGGASAAYGSDALAGVINFILKEETDGWELNAGSEMTERGDSEIYNFNITNGGTFGSGKGSYLVHADFLDRKPTFFNERSLTTRSLIDVQDENGNLSLTQDLNRYPVTKNAIMLNPFVDFDPSFLSADVEEFAGATILHDNQGGISVNRFYGGAARTAFDQALQADPYTGLNAYSFLQLPQERQSLKVKLAYDFGPAEPYVDIYYSKSEVPQVFNGAFMGFPTNFGYSMSLENSPFLNDETKQTLSDAYRLWSYFQPADIQYVDANQNGIADSFRMPFLFRLFTDTGPWTNDRSFESLQIEFGVRGDVGSNWGYDLFVQIGEVESITDISPLLNPDKIQQGLLLNEQGQCIDPSNGCVPVNIWSDDIGDAAAEFIKYPDGAGRSVTVNKQNVVMGTLSGNTAGWFSLPGNPGPIGLVLGFEYREIDANIDTPEFMEQGRFEGAGLAPVVFSLDEKVDFKNVLAEAVVPLVSGKPGIDFLELELGLRSSEHSLTGRDNTFKTALSYYPNEDLQIRASYNRAIRSPAINELYQYNQTLGYIWDPCMDFGERKFVDDGKGNGYFIEATETLAATCIGTGVPEASLYNANFYNPVIERNLGGNPNLSPEDAKTLSVGVVWTPYVFDGLSVSFDYFKVEIDDYIELTPVTSGELIISCYDENLGRGGLGSPACNTITRDENGSMQGIFAGYQNLGLHKVDGFDLNIEYGFEFLSGYVDINYFATKLLNRSIEDDIYGDVNFDCLGYFNGDCDNLIDYPVFDFKHRMTVGYSRGDLELQAVWKYVSSLKDGNDAVEYYTETLDAYSLVDLSGRYQINENFALILGVKNVFDEEPQPIGSNSWEWLKEDIGTFSNTYTQYYDVFGRTMFLKLSARF